MKLGLLNGSLVVLAETHNPSILHPAFLAGQGIVPADWQLAEPPVCTPAISVVKYANQVVFVAEPNKFQIVDNAPTAATPIPSVAAKYIETLPHVRYMAVGLNFAAFLECETPEKFLVERFLAPGPWNKVKPSLNSVGFSFIYPVERGVLRLSCEVGSLRKKGDKADQTCLLVNANYHVEIARANPVEECKIAVGLYGARLAHFEEITQIVFGLER